MTEKEFPRDSPVGPLGPDRRPIPMPIPGTEEKPVLPEPAPVVDPTPTLKEPEEDDEEDDEDDDEEEEEEERAEAPKPAPKRTVGKPGPAGKSRRR